MSIAHLLILFSFITSWWPLQASGEQRKFVPLFNGKDLSGWVHSGGDADSFKVEQGAILCTGAGNYPNWLPYSAEGA